jgi:hypothetical protein
VLVVVRSGSQERFRGFCPMVRMTVSGPNAAQALHLVEFAFSASERPSGVQ